jgi:hypothetical protein
LRRSAVRDLAASDYYIGVAIAWSAALAIFLLFGWFPFSAITGS